RVEVGASSRDLRGSTSVHVAGDEVRIPLTANSSIGELLAHPAVGPIVSEQLAGGQAAADGAMDAGIMSDEAMAKMMASFPIGRLAGFPGMGVTREQVAQLIALGNQS